MDNEKQDDNRFADATVKEAIERLHRAANVLGKNFTFIVSMDMKEEKYTKAEVAKLRDIWTKVFIQKTQGGGHVHEGLRRVR